MNKTLIAKKHAAAIGSLFNTIKANDIMLHGIEKDVDACIPLGDRLPSSYWINSSRAAARALRDLYGIDVPGITSTL